MNKIKFTTLNKQLKDINNLSLNELKYLYNDLQMGKREYLNYQKEKKSYITNISKFIYVIFFTLLILNLKNIIVLTILILLGAFGFNQIDKINDEISQNNYTKNLLNIEEQIKKLQLIEEREKTYNKSLPNSVNIPSSPNISQKEMLLTRMLKKGIDK